MKVHDVIGNGFQERIYQRCLAIELQNFGLLFQREVEQAITYAGITVGKRKADFVIDGKIIVELKALTSLEGIDIMQAKNYLVAFNLPIGLLINFGGVRLEYKRIFNPYFQ